MKSTILKKVIMLILLTTGAFSQDYYISNEGDDNNNGTYSTPWQTISKVNATVGNGDKIYFHKGQIFRGTLDISEEENIEFNSYGDEDDSKPIISTYDTDTLPSSIYNLRRYNSNFDSAFIIYNSTNITVKNLEFIGSYASGRIKYSNNITLENLNIGTDSLNGIIIGTGDSNDEDYNNINDIYQITIDSCNITNQFTKFVRLNEDKSEDYYDNYGDDAKSFFTEDQTDDGLIVYSMTNSEIKDNHFQDWGHANINLDASNKDENGNPLAPRDISYNKILNNYLTSPNIAYGGRIGVDEAHHNDISYNIIFNTSIESQLNGHDNNYTNNIFDGTHFPKYFSDHTAVSVETYDDSDIYNNLYKDNEIKNAINGVGLKILISDSSRIYENSFERNIISDNGNNIQLEIKSYSNIHDNSYTNNIINGNGEVVVSYHERNISVFDFNGMNNNNDYDDIINGNDDTITLSSGIFVTSSIEQGEMKYYKIAVQNGQTLTMSLSELAYDLDLYVKVGEKPTSNTPNDPINGSCNSGNYETADESCSLTLNEDDDVYIGVDGFSASSYKLEGIIINGGDENVLNVSDTVAETEIKYYKVTVEKGQSVHVLLNGLNADADLYVKVGERPDIEDKTDGYDCTSTNGGTNDDSCTVDINENSIVHIAVHGYSTADYTLTATLSENLYLH